MRNAGDQVIRVADERRTALAGYWSHFESVDAQVKKALDQNNWKIFGRVISRQSLSGLSRELDDIRRSSTQLNSGDNAALLDSLAQTQAHFGATLERNAAGLARSQGAAWVEELRREFAGLLESRGQLVRLDGENPQGVAPFERGAEELAGVVRGITAAVRKLRRGGGAAPDMEHVDDSRAAAIGGVRRLPPWGARRGRLARARPI